MKVGAFEVDDGIGSLQEPVALSTLRPWIDAGSVGKLVLGRIQDRLGAKDVGELERPGDFFDFTRYRPTVRYDGEEREFVVPNTRITSAKRGDGPDLLFLDILEPHSRAEEYMESIVEVLATAGAKTHWRIGAWYGGVPHTRPLQVSRAVGGHQVDPKTGEPIRPTRRYEGPTSIMSLINASLDSKGIGSNSLMLQLPHYAQLEEDFSAAAAVLEAAAEVFDLRSELGEAILGMKARGERQYDQLSHMVSEDSDLKEAVARLEQIYDAEHRPAEPEGPALSPEIERFLGEITRGMDEGEKDS